MVTVPVFVFSSTVSTGSDHHLGGHMSEFWADRARAAKDDPPKRLRIALDNRPYPAAYREAAIALRALIRERRKAGEPYDDLLEQLYRVAAEENFIYPGSIGPGTLQGYNVAQFVPLESLDALDFPYREIGYEELSLLKKTDRRWIVEAWGEPEQHVSAQDRHRTYWQGFVDLARRAMEERRRKIWDDGLDTAQPSQRSTSASGGCLVLLLLGSATAVAACGL